MIISPIAPALWIVAMLTLISQIVSFGIFGKPFMDPFMSVVIYLFFIEASKFVAQLTLEEDDGE